MGSEELAIDSVGYFQVVQRDAIDVYLTHLAADYGFSLNDTTLVDYVPAAAPHQSSFRPMDLSADTFYIAAYRSDVPPGAPLPNPDDPGGLRIVNGYTNANLRSCVGLSFANVASVARPPSDMPWSETSIGVITPVYYRPWTHSTLFEPSSDERGFVLSLLRNESIVKHADLHTSLAWSLVDVRTGDIIIEQHQRGPPAERTVDGETLLFRDQFSFAGRVLAFTAQPTPMLLSSYDSEFSSALMGIGVPLAVLLSLLFAFLLFHSLKSSHAKAESMLVRLFPAASRLQLANNAASFCRESNTPCKKRSALKLT